MPKTSDKIWIAVITGIVSIVTAGITTFGVIRNNSSGIAESQDKLAAVNAQIAGIKPEVPVGTVIASLLDEREFAKAVGDPDDFDTRTSKWTLADGKTVPGTEWAKLRVNSPVPNLCGVFLRGKNNSKFLVGKSPQDVFNRRRKDIEEIALGDYRDDSVGPHQHKLWINNSTTQQATGFVYNGNSTATFGYTDLMPLPDEPPETQPKNVTVNFFVKINSFVNRQK
jgi:hypothetical protein